MVCDMFFETELSEKLNNELESAGISVSEELVAKTLAAVQAAREAESGDAEWNEASEENISKLIELAGVRKRRLRGLAPVLFRAATVMAACFVLVVGAFALRFSTMRMGSEEAAPMMPRTTAENGSAQNDMKYATDAYSIVTDEDYDLYGAPMEAHVEESMVVAEASDEVDMEPVVPTVKEELADDADAVEAENAGGAVSEVQNPASWLTEQLAQAESVRMSRNEQGIRLYEFFVRDSAGVPGYYNVYEDGTVMFGEIPPDGQTGTIQAVGGSEDKAFRRAVLVWMKEQGYSF